MAVRSTMANLITRTRVLINDPAGANQLFSDQDVQDVMDESRVDYRNEVLIPKPTFLNSTISYLDYYHPLGGWEDSPVLKQYLITTVSPSTSEAIAGHWTFAATTLPPIYITGSVHDVYRAAADLLERLAARWVLAYNIMVDGQNLQRSQAAVALQSLAKTYRMKQRAVGITAIRTDLTSAAHYASLQPTELDYMGSGQ